jgi:hypothetical protein
MSNAAGLVRDTSKALFVNEASLAVQMRFLREAGLIPTGGRGTGGYAMRPRDAGSLLIAAAVTSAIKDTAEITQVFLNLPMKHWDVKGPSRPLQWASRGGTLPGLEQDTVIRKFGLGRVSWGSTFQQTLETVLEMFIRKQIFPELSPSDFREPPDPEMRLDYRHSMSIQFFLPLPCVVIAYYADRILQESISFGGFGDLVNIGSYRRIIERAEMEGCLVQFKQVDEVAIEKIAESVGQEGLRSALQASSTVTKRLSKRKAKAGKREPA